jgi:hypothetical protein
MIFCHFLPIDGLYTNKLADDGVLLDGVWRVFRGFFRFKFKTQFLTIVSAFIFSG